MHDSAITRRLAILSAGVLAAAGSSVGYRSVAAPQAAQDDFDIGNPMPDVVETGKDTALAKELSDGRNITNGAPGPGNTSLLYVFTYFEGLKSQNGQGEFYNAGWQQRWNPVLMFFFTDIRLKWALDPAQGDDTPWCAAALNWALDRSGMQTTGSARANSFFGTVGRTDHPKKGDIVAFMAPNNPSRCHVGIYIETVPGGIISLGGKQLPNKDSGHPVRHNVLNRGLVPTSYYVVHSFHSIEAFH